MHSSRLHSSSDAIGGRRYAGADWMSGGINARERARIECIPLDASNWGPSEAMSSGIKDGVPLQNVRTESAQRNEYVPGETDSEEASRRRIAISFMCFVFERCEGPSFVDSH